MFTRLKMFTRNNLMFEHKFETCYKVSSIRWGYFAEVDFSPTMVKFQPSVMNMVIPNVGEKIADLPAGGELYFTECLRFHNRLQKGKVYFAFNRKFNVKVAYKKKARVLKEYNRAFGKSFAKML